MVGWSTLNSCRSFLQRVIAKAPIRQMSGHGPRTMVIKPSRWQYDKFKDFVHFYFMLGIIPLSVLTAGVNVFVGPATLSEIPEGYTPKYWEYYKNPITRFIARYILTDPQQDYEKLLHMLFEEEETRRLRRIEVKAKLLVKERGDYKVYYYEPYNAKYATSIPNYDADDVKRAIEREDDWDYSVTNLN